MTNIKEEDIIKYIYKESIDTSIKEYLDVSIVNKNPEIIKMVYSRVIVKRENDFKNAHDHLKWYNDSKNRTQDLLNKEFFPNIKPEGKIPQTPFFKKIKYLIIGIILILIMSTIYFLNRPIESELTIFVDNQLQTNELPTLPPKYETVLSTDDRPKELAKAYKDREYKKAITLIKEEQANPENEFIKSELDFILAVCYLRTGKNKKAIGLLKPITLDNSTYSSDAKLELSYAYIKTGDYKKAYNLSIDIKENSSSFYQKEAEETIKEILEFKPSINQN